MADAIDNSVITKGTKVISVPSIKDEANKDVPNVYHYTSIDALKSIIEEKTVRFTDIQYMNDAREVLDGLNIMHKTFNPKWKEENGFYFDIFEYCKSFVFCMSLSSDELPLWNYYSKNNKYEGYNIAFDYNELMKAIINNNNEILEDCSIIFGNVVYGDKQKLLIAESGSNKVHNDINKAMYTLFKAMVPGIAKEQDKSIDDLMNQIKKPLDKDDSIPNYYQVFRFNNSTGNFDRELFPDALYFSKHNAFSFEHEIRIVINMPKEKFTTLQKDKKIKYRTFNNNLIPYIELNFDISCIDGINIAPMLKSDIAENGIESFLSSLNINLKNGIEKSKIPIRY